MDRYDAILEQLKKAQSQGVDSVASRLEAVVANLDELLQTTKATVQSALSSAPDETFPIAKVEALVTKMREEALGRGEAPSPSGVTLDNLRTLDEARSQSELLRSLLPMLAHHIGRAVVFVIREGAVSAWSGVGFDDQDEFRSWHGQITASPNIQKLVEGSTPLGFVPVRDPLFSSWLGDTRPDEAVLLPISLRGKLMGIVYVDHAGDQPWNLDAAQALNAVACWLIDTLQFRTAVPTPTLAEIDVSTAPYEEKARQEVFETPAEETAEKRDSGMSFELPSEPEAAKRAPAAPAIGSSEVEEIDYDFEPEPATFDAESPESGFDPSATVRVDSAVEFTPPEVEAQPQAAEPPMAEEMPTPPPVQPIKPPVDVSKPAPAVSGGATRSPEDEARQEEARRFARLLVSEIKLYNEDEVERGRAEKDIGVRLKDDIERSREMFEKRISEDVRAGHDYFRDELVRILADGDADALGV